MPEGVLGVGYLRKGTSCGSCGLVQDPGLAGCRPLGLPLLWVRGGIIVPSSLSELVDVE